MRNIKTKDLSPKQQNYQEGSNNAIGTLRAATDQTGDDVRALPTSEGSSVSVPSDWLKSPVLRGRTASSSSSSWLGPSPRVWKTESPPTSASTMPSRLSVNAASRAAFSSSICRGRRRGEHRVRFSIEDEE